MKTIKLLLIEDNEDLSYILKNSMEDVDDGGYEVDIALNGEEGLKQFELFKPDVIVADIKMPKMDGLEFVKHIRQKDRNMPIILATGKNLPKDVIEGYNTGANLYIKKPYTPEELDAHIKSLLGTIESSRLRLMSDIPKIGKYTFDHKNRLLIYNDSDEQRLTARDSDILKILLQHKGEIVEREYLLKIFWGVNYVDTASNSLNVFITKLRKYFSKDPSIKITNVKLKGLILDFD